MENPTLTIRIPADLKAAVKRAAGSDDRSVTSYVVKALRAALALGPASVAAANAIEQEVRPVGALRPAKAKAPRR